MTIEHKQSKETSRHTVPTTAVVRCCRCGVAKPYDELNGTNILTGDNSHAYCRRLAECKSQEADSQITELLGWLEQ